MPKSATSVKTDSDIVGFFLLKQADQSIGKAVNAGCGFTFTVRPIGGTARGEGKISPVSDGVTIE
jgi:hypothetical protein